MFGVGQSSWRWWFGRVCGANGAVEMKPVGATNEAAGAVLRLIDTRDETSSAKCLEGVGDGVLRQTEFRGERSH